MGLETEGTGKAGVLLTSRGRPGRGELSQEKRWKDSALGGDWASLSLVLWGGVGGCPQEAGGDDYPSLTPQASPAADGASSQDFEVGGFWFPTRE